MIAGSYRRAFRRAGEVMTITSADGARTAPVHGRASAHQTADLVGALDQDRYAVRLLAEDLADYGAPAVGDRIEMRGLRYRVTAIDHAERAAGGEVLAWRVDVTGR